MPPPPPPRPSPTPSHRSRRPGLVLASLAGVLVAIGVLWTGSDPALEPSPAAPEPGARPASEFPPVSQTPPPPAALAPDPPPQHRATLEVVVEARGGPDDVRLSYFPGVGVQRPEPPAGAPWAHSLTQQADVLPVPVGWVRSALRAGGLGPGDWVAPLADVDPWLAAAANHLDSRWLDADQRDARRAHRDAFQARFGEPPYSSTPGQPDRIRRDPEAARWYRDHLPEENDAQADAVRAAADRAPRHPAAVAIATQRIRHMGAPMEALDAMLDVLEASDEPTIARAVAPRLQRYGMEGVYERPDRAQLTRLHDLARSHPQALVRVLAASAYLPWVDGQPEGHDVAAALRPAAEACRDHPPDHVRRWCLDTAAQLDDELVDAGVLAPSTPHAALRQAARACAQRGGWPDDELVFHADGANGVWEVHVADDGVSPERLVACLRELAPGPGPLEVEWLRVQIRLESRALLRTTPGRAEAPPAAAP